MVRVKKCRESVATDEQWACGGTAAMLNSIDKGVRRYPRMLLVAGAMVVQVMVLMLLVAVVGLRLSSSSSGSSGCV